MARNRQLVYRAYPKTGDGINTAASINNARRIVCINIDTILFIAACTVLIVLSIHPPSLAQLKTTRQLTSNNIIALAGGTGGFGDTLWLATERGVNFRLPQQGQQPSDWHGFEAGDLLYRFFGLAFGGGGAAALINKDNLTDSIGFWHFSHADGRQRQKFFRFPQDVRGDSTLPVGGIVHAFGSFWVPFNYGGIVRYDPASNSVYAIRPTDAGESIPQNMGAIGGDADTKAVRMLDVNTADNSITVTTPSVLWKYLPADKKWDTLHIAPTLAAAGEAFVSFEAAFTVNKKDASTLYSFMMVRIGGENHSFLYAFDAASNTWAKAIDNRARYALFPAVNGCFYTLSDNNVNAYADTSINNTTQNNALSVIMPPADFREMLKNAGDDPNPRINDILFLPKTDSSGMLAVATETGLYVSAYVEPLSNRYDGFTHSYYIKDVSPSEAYALPGIVRGGMDGRYERCVFVYRLKKDGNVTIRVYDYNMSLVKTVVKNERRSAQTARSTNPASDFWDGTNSAGKRAWPGVYYFKITSSGGERHFGKIILAK